MLLPGNGKDKQPLTAFVVPMDEHFPRLEWGQDLQETNPSETNGRGEKKTSDQIRLVGETGLVADSIKFLILSIANLPSGTLT